MALLPPRFLDTVVALGTPNSKNEVQYKATGFLCGYPVDGTDQFRTFLITNRHVLEGVSSLKSRFNRPMGSQSKIYDVPLSSPDGSPLWTVHPDKNCDVAVIGISFPQLRKDGIEFDCFRFLPNQILSLEQARENQASEGDGVFVLGFPLGEAGEERNYAIVRQGIIARIRDWLGGNSRTYSSMPQSIRETVGVRSYSSQKSRQLRVRSLIQMLYWRDGIRVSLLQGHCSKLTDRQSENCF